MNYPMWDVPILGTGWVIGIIAIFHVLISQFAVGGGFFLPLAEAHALKNGRRDWLKVLQSHSKFFLILTGVFGAGSGVGIWFAIGLASPEGTSTLIHNFVFGWAIEWVFFMIELTCAAVYYYTWGRVSDKVHLRLGWLYAGASFLTLVIINGILSFMLTPGATWLGVAGTGNESGAFWYAFFNPTYWPSLFLRILVCINLAAIWGLLTASFINGEEHPKLKTDVIRYTTKWLLPGFFLMPVCFLWYLYCVPEQHLGLLNLGISTIGQGIFTQVTRMSLVVIMTSASILAVAYFLAYRNPVDFGPGHAIAIVLLAAMATASGEQAREMIRKPYVIGGHMYSNGIRLSEVEGFNRDGYLTKTPWASDEERLAWAAFDASLGEAEVRQASTEPATPARPKASAEVLRRGQLMYAGQCYACHTTDGYRSMRKMLKGRDYASISSLTKMLHTGGKDSPYVTFMPPLVGTAGEIEALNLFLDEMVNGAPAPAVEPAKQVANQP